MVKRVAVHDIALYRDGKDMIVPAGTIFDFTSQEVESINQHNKKALGKLPEQADKKAEDKPVAEAPEKIDTPTKAESAKK